MEELGGALISFDGRSQYSSKQTKKEPLLCVTLKTVLLNSSTQQRNIFRQGYLFIIFYNTIFVAKAAQNQVELCCQLDSVKSSVVIFASDVV